MTDVASDRVVGDLPLRSAAAAADVVGEESTMLVSGFGSVGYPKAVPEALADSGRDRSLTVVSGGSVGTEIDVLLTEAGAIARRFPYQARQPMREAVNRGAVAFHDRHISSLGDEVRYGGLASDEDVVAVVEAVAVGPDWLVPSTSIGHTPAFVAAADRLVVEVNEAQPRSLERVHDISERGPPPGRDPIPLGDPGERIGSPRVGFDPGTLAAVVRTDRRDEPYTFRDPTAVDDAIAENLAGFLAGEVERNPVLEDVLTLQFGVGSLGNALMGALGDADLGGHVLRYYGEVIQDGLLSLLDAGRLESASATSLALSSAGQDRFFAAVDRYASDVVLRPAAVSNSPAVIERFGVVAVNSGLEVDLASNVNSTHVRGRDLVNGIGGSGDFNRNALVSVTALPSTAGGGDVPRIVPRCPHVDHTEHDVDVVVTEQGVADLRGRSPRERAELLVERCAHPRYRDALRAYLDDAVDAGGHVPVDFERAASWFAE